MYENNVIIFVHSMFQMTNFLRINLSNFNVKVMRAAKSYQVLQQKRFTHKSTDKISSLSIESQCSDLIQIMPKDPMLN